MTDPILEIDSRIRSLLQLPEELSLNDLGGEFAAHSMYCRLLGISGGVYDSMMREDIRSRGIVRIFKRESLSNRILSTQTVPKPTIPVVDLTADSDGTGEEAGR